MFKFLKQYWTRILSILLFVLLSSVYVRIFAIGTPYNAGETLDPACEPGEVNCTVNIIPALTAGSVIFSDGTADLSQDNANLFWDDTNNRLGIGTTSPAGNLAITQTATATGALKGIVYTGAVNTNQTLSTEIPSLTLTTAGRQWATGALATQREVLITQPTYSFVGASTITDAATLGIAGAPIKSTNATITNTHGLLIQAGAVSTATNSYGLTVNAQTGATNNYAAVFSGGNVGIGTTSPTEKIDIVGNINISSGQYYKYNGVNFAMANITLNNYFTGGAGNLTMTGASNTADGFQALSSNTTGNENSAQGYQSLYSNTTGDGNIAIGYQAGYFNNGFINLFIGYQSGFESTGGNSNSFVGISTGYSNTTGYNNSFFGKSAGLSNTTGYNNSFFGGNDVGTYNTTGNNNSFFGTSAGRSNTTGSYNLYLGYSTDGSTSFSSSIGIGYNTTVTANNQLVIGSSDPNGSITDAYFGQGVTKVSPSGIILNATGGSGINNVGAPFILASGKGTGNASGGSIIFQTSDAGTSGATLQFLTTKAILLASGNFGIGDTTPDALLDVHGTVCLDLNADDVCTDNTSALSDERLKTDVTNLENALNLVKELRPVRFQWNGENNTGTGTSLGFLAQEVEDIFPELVITDTAGYKNLDYSKLTAVLVGAIQDIDLKITDINNLETENSWRESILNWFADVSNGITEFVASVLRAKDKLCIGEGEDEVCITKEELLQIKNNSDLNSNDNNDTSNDTTDDTVDEIIDDTTDDTVDDTVDDTTDDIIVDDTTEDIIDETIDDTTDDAVDETIDDTTEDTITEDTIVEDTVDDTTEIPVE